MLSATAQRDDAGALGVWVVALLALRWVAGIAEPYTVSLLSEAVAMAALAMLGVTSLLRMRLAAPSLLLVTGLAAWIFVALLSTAANGTENTDAAALVALLMLYALVADTATVGLASRRPARYLAAFLTAFILVGAALSVFQVLARAGFVDPGKPGLYRAFGSDVHPVSFGIQIVLAMVGCEVLRQKDGRPFTAAHALVLAAGVLALYLTFARTAWLMAGVIGLTVVGRQRGALSKLAVAAVALAGFMALQLSGRFGDLASLPQFLEHFSPGDRVFDFRYVDNSLSWRIVNWTFGFTQALERPLLGFGPGQSAAASAFSLEMHNIFLETFFEGGLFGLAAFCLVLAGFLRLHATLPRATGADRRVRHMLGATGLALLAAVTLSTSLVDQLMTVLIYLVVLGAARRPADLGQPPAAPRIASMLAA